MIPPFPFFYKKKLTLFKKRLPTKPLDNRQLSFLNHLRRRDRSSHKSEAAHFGRSHKKALTSSESTQHYEI